MNDGYIEVTLLGQNVNSYNYDGVRFPELLKRVNDEVRGLKRLRFMTSHPKDLSDELIDAMASLDKVCKHIHFAGTVRKRPNSPTYEQKIHELRIIMLLSDKLSDPCLRMLK